MSKRIGQTAASANISTMQSSGRRKRRLIELLLLLTALSSQTSSVAAQYYRASGGSLVTSDRLASSLALTRPGQQRAASPLDNVIESTPASLLGPKLLAAPSCQLPPTWAGRWYQSNKEPIRVTNTEISDKGICRDQKGDKYLFELPGGVRHTSQNQQIHQNQQQQQPQQHQSQQQHQQAHTPQTSGAPASAPSTPCLICLVINERHLNVLQYKESSCQPITANYLNRTSNAIVLDDDHALLDSVCSDITGDAQLESLFRLDTPAIECPITGQYSFTYDSCREPQSSIDSCIDKKQLNFKFSACPDIQGSESKYEVLKCYADWSEGNNYYMIGRLEHASNQADRGKFRCFVYEKSPDGKSILMAQSLEESCYGLINASEGPKTLRLTVKPTTVHKCNFPLYIQSQSENWLSVDNSLIYMFNQNSTKYQVKETKEGNVIEEATCLQQFSSPQAFIHPHLHQHVRSNNQPQQAINRRHSSSTASYLQADQSTQPKMSSSDVVYLVQITKSCQTTNYCVRFYRRSNGIVQIDYFIHSPGDHQCRSAFAGTPQTQIITSTNLEHQRCPFEGAYTIEAPIESDLTYNPSNIFVCPRQSFLTSQCDHPSRLRIHSKCSPGKFTAKNLHCLGSWTTNGLVRLLLADDERQRYSAWYRDYSGLIGNLHEANQFQDGAEQSTSVAPMTRSQHLMSASSSSQQYMMNSLAPIVDLQIALITPLPIVARPMQVRLTRRNHCSDLKGYMSQGQGWFASQISTISSSLPSYYASSSSATSASSSSSPSSTISHPQALIIFSFNFLIVNLLLPFVNRFDLTTRA